jgi:hypothetical protein
VGLAACLGLVAAAAGALTAGGSRRRLAGVAVAALGLLGPLLGGGESIPGRAVAALAAVWIFARTLDLWRDPTPWSIGRRILLVIALFDSRQARREPARLDPAGALRAVGFGALGLAGLWGAFVLAPRFAGAPAWGLRWLCGLVFVYALPEAIAGGLRSAGAAVGVAIPELHRDPIAAASLREFWGVRWNRTVGSWLRRHFWLPFARRRRPVHGLAAAFAASALLHAWFAGVALGPGGAAVMGSYFLVQGVLVGLEARLALPGPAGRVFALLGAGLPAPLFVEPILRVVEPWAGDLWPAIGAA